MRRGGRLERAVPRNGKWRRQEENEGVLLQFRTNRYSKRVKTSAPQNGVEVPAVRHSVVPVYDTRALHRVHVVTALTRVALFSTLVLDLRSLTKSAALLTLSSLFGVFCTFAGTSRATRLNSHRDSASLTFNHLLSAEPSSNLFC